MKKQRKILNENGAASVLVLFTIFTFVVILMGAFMSVSTLRKSQLKSDMQIKEVYGKDTQKVDEVYNDIMEKMDNTKLPYDKPYIPVGFEHIGTSDWNSGYQIKETATGNIFVWVPCVTDQSKVKAGDKVETFKKTLPTPKEDGTLDTSDPYYMYNKWNLTITGDESPADAIKTSVGTYGGFYIAAYEAGIEGTTENYDSSTNTGKTVTDGSVKPLSQDGKGVWNCIKREDALTVASKMVETTDGVKSGLISGACWDTTLQWMVNSSSNATENEKYDIDSIDKGWYGQIDKTTTGQYPINNIYDMAGNVWELTTENCTNSENSGLAIRGGSYGDASSEDPAASRSYDDGNTHDYVGFRVVIYK